MTTAPLDRPFVAVRRTRQGSPEFNRNMRRLVLGRKTLGLESLNNAQRRADLLNRAAASRVAAGRKAVLLEAANELDEHAAKAKAHAFSPYVADSLHYIIESNVFASAAEKLRARALQEPT